MKKNIPQPQRVLLRFRAEDIAEFERIVSGEKRIETRAATPKYRTISPGDKLEITCANRRITKTVTAVAIYKTIASLSKAVDMRLVMPSKKTLSEIRAVYNGYPGYREKIRQYGIIAFTIV